MAQPKVCRRVRVEEKRRSRLLPEVEIADAPAWLTSAESYGLSLNKTEKTVSNGQRNSTLTRLAGAMRRHGSSLSAIENALLADNLQRCSPPLPDEEVRRIAVSISQYGSEDRSVKPHGRRPDLVRLSDVHAKAVEWLWEPYLPLEMLTILSGDPAIGKTFICLAIASALTRGRTVVSGLRRSTLANVFSIALRSKSWWRPGA